MESNNEVSTILIVEDDERIAKLLTQFLRSEGFDTSWVKTGEEAIDTITSTYPDLVVLDLMLPGIDGVEVCQKVRGYYDNFILMLTAHNGDIQEVTALNAGVDDFITKPIRTHVLIARINALLRRNKKADQNEISVSDLVINHSQRSVTRNGTQLEMTDSEFELLWTLVTHAGTVVKREDLFKDIRGKNYDGLDRSIDMRISKLRKKLSGKDNTKDYIRTLRQLGYLFVKE